MKDWKILSFNNTTKIFGHVFKISFKHVTHPIIKHEMLFLNRSFPHSIVSTPKKFGQM